MCTVVFERDGEGLTRLRYLDEPFGTSLFQSRFHTQTGGYDGLYGLIRIVEQGLELFVGLGKRIGRLACGLGYLHGRINSQIHQRVGQLDVAHQGLTVYATCGEKLLLPCSDSFKMLFQ